MYRNHARWVLPIAFTLSLLATACSLPEPTSSGLEPLATAPIADTDAGRTKPVDVPDASLGEDSLLALSEPVLDEFGGLEAEVEAPFEAHPAPATGSYELRRGESIAHFARWAELPVETVAETSGLDLLEALPVGTEILVPADTELQSRIEVRRTAHHHRRAEGYLESRGGNLGTEFYTVQTGDTAWSIASNEVGVPVWLIETFNPAVDLDRLRPGQDLMVPIVADTVVELDD